MKEIESQQQAIMTSRTVMAMTIPTTSTSASTTNDNKEKKNKTTNIRQCTAERCLMLITRNGR